MSRAAAPGPGEGAAGLREVVRVRPTMAAASRPAPVRDAGPAAAPDAAPAPALSAAPVLAPDAASAPDPARDATRLAGVSVVIPCHDYGAYLEECVTSVLTQRGVRVRVLVVDDASHDDSPAVARRLAAADPRVTVIEHHFNRGPVHTFNHGLALAGEEFVVRLDADDALTPGSLARSVAVARAFPSVGLVYGHPLHYDDGAPRPRPSQRASSWTVWPGRSWLADRCRSGFNTITSPEVLMRRSVVALVGGQQEQLAYTHDMEMWLRISGISDVAYIHGADQAWHREHAASLSAREVTPLSDLVNRREAFRALFAGRTGELPEAGALADDADRALAGDALERASQLLDGAGRAACSVAEYVDFALETCFEARELPQWGRLQARLESRSEGRPVRPRFVAERVLRRLRTDRSHRSWHRNGVWR